MKKRGVPKEESFSKLMIKCSFHQLRKTKFGHRFICARINSTCNKMNCPRLKRRNLLEAEKKSS